MNNLYETTEATLVAAHKSGMAYWTRNKPYDALEADLVTLANTLGYRGQENEAWLAGYYGAKRRALHGGI